MRTAAGVAVAFILAFASSMSNAGGAAAVNLGQWQFNPGTGHFYAQVDGLTWNEAEAFAVSHGGHLVTINDQAEQDWLSATFTQDNLFIGFNDRAEEGVWVWTSAEPVTYTNWTLGEPNDWQEWFPGEDVAVMNWRDEGGHLGWNDLNEGEAGFVSSIIEMASSFPLNDFLVDATPIFESPFIDQVDMTGATFEPGEASPCQNGELMDGSVWYRFTTPAKVVNSIEIGGAVGGVAAAVYGPFEGVPASATDLGDPAWCVNDPDSDHALIEVFEQGTVVVQLTTDFALETEPYIRIDWRPAYFWIDNESVKLTSATVDRSGTITYAGTAACVLQAWMPWGDTYPEAYWNWTGENEGFYAYDIQGQSDQALGRKTLLRGGAWGQIDCTNADQNGLFHWTLSSRADNGKFGPNATQLDFGIGRWEGEWFNAIAGLSTYTKVTKTR